MTDIIHGLSLEVESKLLGNMGIDDLLKRLDERTATS